MTPSETPAPTPATAPPAARPEPSGIGGWLILPAIGLCLTPFILGFGIFQILQVVSSPDFASNSAGLRAFVLIEMAVNLAMLAFVIYLLFSFFSKRPGTPRLMIAFYLLSLIIVTVDTAVAANFFDVQFDAQAVKEVARSVTAAAIWVPYFLNSRRVANTFRDSAAPV